LIYPPINKPKTLAASIFEKMKVIKGLIIILTIIGGLSCCKPTNDFDSNDIKGVWRAITNDSIYDEIIITDKDFYTYDDFAGDLLLTYKLENDSLKIFYYNGLQSARQFKRINKDEFIEQDSAFTIKFERLNIQIDTAKVLSTKSTSDKDFDENYYYKYINDWRQRRKEWESVKNASR
jgi:hypothetical protein